LSPALIAWTSLIALSLSGVAASQLSRERSFWPAIAGVAGVSLIIAFGLYTLAPVVDLTITSRMNWTLMIALVVIVALFERRALIPADGRIAWGGIFAVLGIGFIYVVARGGEIPDEVWRQFGIGIAVAAARDELIFRGVLPALADRYVTVRDEFQFPYRFGPIAWGLALVYGLYQGVQVIGTDVSFFFLPFLFGVISGLVLALVRAMTGTILAPLALHVGIALLILGNAG
jgi:hypothetical protein